jgi:hypothetical protein
VKTFDVVEKLRRYCGDRALHMNRSDLPGPWRHESRTVLCDGAFLFARDGAADEMPPVPTRGVLDSLSLLNHRKAASLGCTTGRHLRDWAGPMPRLWSEVALPIDVLEQRYGGWVNRWSVDRRYLAILARTCNDDDRIEVATVPVLNTADAIRFSSAGWSAVLMPMMRVAKTQPRLRLRRSR